MATTKLAGSMARKQQPTSRTRTATVLDLVEPTVDEADNPTGWQVLLDYDGGEIRRAGVASSYTPVPGDQVAVIEYQNTVFVVDRVSAGDTGELPGARVAYAYVEIAAAGTYGSAGTATEVAIPGLAVTVLLRDGAAYDVELRTGFTTTTANQFGLFRLRLDTAVSGTDLAEYFRVASTVANTQMQFHDVLQIKNDTGIDQTVTIVPCVTGPPTGTLNLYATPRAEPFVEVRLKGAAKLYTPAAPLPLPAEFTG